jgi:acyl-coenzyme A thioesterase PaaI-like protein
MGTWPQVNMNLPDGYSQCFGCGQENPIGLKLKFHEEGKGVKAEFVAGEQYQGWPGYLHGGIVGCLLDEAMSYAVLFAGHRCVTARFEVRLKHLTPINEPLTITASVTRKTRKVIECTSAIGLKNGTIVAEGNATQFLVDAGDNKSKEKHDDQ